MTVNPMQRKSTNSFILGLFIGLILTVIVSVFLYMQIMKLNKDSKNLDDELRMLPVTTQNILAFNPIKPTMLKNERIRSDILASEIVTSKHLSGALELSDVDSSLDMKKSNKKKAIVGVKENFATISTPTISTDTPAENNSNTNANNANNNANNNTNSNTQNNSSNSQSGNIDLSQEEDEAMYYAAVTIPKGSIITKDMIRRKEDLMQNEKNNLKRLMEYNMVSLPSKLRKGETIDIRISFPSGQDFIVVTKKIVEDTDDVSIWLKMDEEEILKMRCAIIESYILGGTKLYAALYTSPGLQKKPIPTYPVNPEVYNQISQNRNIDMSVKQALIDGQASYIRARDPISTLVDQARAQEGQDRVTTEVAREIKSLKDKRKTFVSDTLGINVE